MSTPDLTVLIPTCDRPQTLRHCLETVVAQDHPGLEIVVSDNAGDPETGEVIRSFSDPRLRALRMPERLGMSEHWEVALGETRGEWVTVIGDDDGLMPGAVSRFLKLAGERDLDAYATMHCGYLWPGAYEKVGACVMARWGQKFEIRESREWLTKVVRGERGYGDLPCIYTGGFVKREVMEEIKRRTGRYFSSIIPDVYSGLAVASVLPRFGYTEEPFAIEGTSPVSNGRTVFKPGAEKEGLPKLFQEGVLRFHPTLGNGNVPSISLMVYECYLQSMPLRDYEVDTGLADQLEIAMSAPKRSHRARVEEYCREVAESNGLDFDSVLKRSRRKSFRRNLRKKLTKILPGNDRVEGVSQERLKDESIDNVGKAAVRLGEMVGRNGRH